MLFLIYPNRLSETQVFKFLVMVNDLRCNNNMLVTRIDFVRKYFNGPLGREKRIPSILKKNGYA